MHIGFRVLQPVYYQREMKFFDLVWFSFCFERNREIWYERMLQTIWKGDSEKNGMKLQDKNDVKKMIKMMDGIILSHIRYLSAAAAVLSNMGVFRRSSRVENPGGGGYSMFSKNFGFDVVKYFKRRHLFVFCCFFIFKFFEYFTGGS